MLKYGRNKNDVLRFIGHIFIFSMGVPPSDFVVVFLVNVFRKGLFL